MTELEVLTEISGKLDTMQTTIDSYNQLLLEISGWLVFIKDAVILAFDIFICLTILFVIWQTFKKWFAV